MEKLVVTYTEKTRFGPAEVLGDEAFPGNLLGSKLTVRGRILTSEGCLLVADRVVQAVTEQAAVPAPASTNLREVVPSRS